MISSNLPALLQLRLLVGFLGERAQFGWWPTAFNEASSRLQQAKVSALTNFRPFAGYSRYPRQSGPGGNVGKAGAGNGQAGAHQNLVFSPLGVSLILASSPDRLQ